MGTLQAYNFLIKAAGMQERRKELFSRAEISKRINEIKYLSSQKKIPKLSLRKEIVNLEQQLHKLTKLEEDLAKDKRKIKNEKIMGLSNRIKLLKQELGNTKALGSKNPEKIFIIENKINELEEKISKLNTTVKEDKVKSFSIEAPVETASADNNEIKHEFLFNLPDKTTLSPSEESFGLPLPPPPKRIVK